MVFQVTEKNLGNIQFNQDMLKTCELILFIASIFSKSLLENDFKVKLKEILTNANQIYETHAILENNTKSVLQIGFNVAKKIENNKVVEIPRLVYFYIGNILHLVTAKYVGIPTSKGIVSNMFRYEGVFTVHLQKKLVKRSSNLKIVQEEWESIQSECGKNNEAVVLLVNNT